MGMREDRKSVLDREVFFKELTTSWKWRNELWNAILIPEMNATEREFQMQRLWDRNMLNMQLVLECGQMWQKSGFHLQCEFDI